MDEELLPYRLRDRDALLLQMLRMRDIRDETLREDSGDDIIGGGDSSPNVMGPQPVFPMMKRMKRDNECMTTIEPIVLSQKWTISNFPSVLKLSAPGSCLRSAVFRDPAQPDACWQLCLYPGGKREENKDHVSLFLKMSATTPNREVCVKAEYRFYFLDETDQPKFTNVNIGDFHAKPPKGGHSWGLRNIPKQKVINGIRADNSLVISCVIELMPDVAKIPCKRMSSPAGPITDMSAVTTTHISNELRMLSTSEHSDILIKVANSEKDFRVHRYKLAAHSDVFRAMLAHEDLEETKSGMITIVDFSLPAVEMMLQFIYSGAIEGPFDQDVLAETMEIADKYNVSSLRTLCEDHMIGMIDAKTCVLFLELAERLNADTILDRCIEIMLAHKNRVMSSPEWQELRDYNPKLANRVLESMLAADNQATPPTKRLRY